LKKATKRFLTRAATSWHCLPNVQRRLIRTARRNPWVTAFAIALLLTLMLVNFDKYYEWDEAVFAGQTGGYMGVAAPAPAMAASREVGPVVLAYVVAQIGSGLSATRMLWAVLTLVLILLAFRALQAATSRGAAVIGFFICSTFWTTQLYMGSIYGSLLGAAAALLAAALYVVAVSRATPSPHWLGIALGLAASTAFWFRHIESLIVLIVLVAHGLVRWRTVVSRWVTFVLAGVSIVVTFVIPWVVDSILRYGSPLGRIQAAQGQDYPRGLTNNVEQYIRLLAGDSYYRAYEAVPRWPSLVFLIILVFVALLFAYVLFIGKGSELAWVPLLLALTAASFGFFFFYSGIIEDRYVLYGVFFLAAGLGVVIDAGMRVVAVTVNAKLLTGVALTLLLLYVGANIALIRPYERGRLLEGQGAALNAATIATLAEGRTCRIFSRYGAPQLQIGSGCVASSVVKPEEAKQMAMAAAKGGAFVAIVWPGESAGQAFPPGWQEVARLLPDGRELRLSFSG
jgi:MFS family permease